MESIKLGPRDCAPETREAFLPLGKKKKNKKANNKKTKELTWKNGSGSSLSISFHWKMRMTLSSLRVSDQQQQPLPHCAILSTLRALTERSTTLASMPLIKLYSSVIAGMASILLSSLTHHGATLPAFHRRAKGGARGTDLHAYGVDTDAIWNAATKDARHRDTKAAHHEYSAKLPNRMQSQGRAITCLTAWERRDQSSFQKH